MFRRMGQNMSESKIKGYCTKVNFLCPSPCQNILGSGWCPNSLEDISAKGRNSGLKKPVLPRNAKIKARKGQDKVRGGCAGFGATLPMVPCFSFAFWGFVSE